RATAAMRDEGLGDWAVTMGRQRLGALTLRNHPLFLQNLPMPRLAARGSETGRLDVVALDVLRDRERGVPRFNEFRRQYGLKTLTSFDDFTDTRLSEDSPARRRQEELADALREVYGQHTCDDSKVISEVQHLNGRPITDCLGHPDGTVVDNVEDVDAVVGWLAESRRPHGFAISETQFTVFIINASRRLFSDRFFTSSFRPEFYGHLGVEWVTNNGPDGVVMEEGEPNGHEQEVSPMKRVLLRAMPELDEELDGVVNAFDPWARDRGEYYSLEWTPRPGAEDDPAFAEPRR
ncbi:MAG TPA: peroxidase family protein, partial [Longimicrobiales bacterium]|nr:peroxidase family protein [Longimicrobiales bacterium]